MKNKGLASRVIGLFFCNKYRKIEEIIDKNLGKPWCWDSIYRNPNLTMEFIEKYPKKCCWNAISDNKFRYGRR